MRARRSAVSASAGASKRLGPAELGRRPRGSRRWRSSPRSPCRGAAARERRGGEARRPPTAGTAGAAGALREARRADRRPRAGRGGDRAVGARAVALAARRAVDPQRLRRPPAPAGRRPRRPAARRRRADRAPRRFDWEDIAAGRASSTSATSATTSRSATRSSSTACPSRACSAAGARPTSGAGEPDRAALPRRAPRRRGAPARSRQRRARRRLEARAAGARGSTSPRKPGRRDDDDAAPPRDASTLGAGEQVTAGDVSADGRTIVLRTYTSAYVWKRRPGERVATALRRKPCTAGAPLFGEGQGEALALAADGRAFYTVPEGPSPPIRRYAPD